MSHPPALAPFRPNPPDPAGVISWVHVGDLHMTSAEEQNYLDLLAIVAETNDVFAGSISFTFLPGDVADHGSAAEYRIVRPRWTTLSPWCSSWEITMFTRRASSTSYVSWPVKPTFPFVLGRSLLCPERVRRSGPWFLYAFTAQLDWLEGSLQV